MNNNRVKVTESLITAKSIIQAVSGSISLTNKIFVERALNHYLKGQELKKKRKYEEAITFFSSAIDLDIQVKYLEERAYCYHKKYEKSLAVADYSKAISIDPLNSELYHERGNISDSLEDLNRAIELNPRNIRAYNNRGLRWSKDIENAKKDWLTAIKLCDKELIKDENNGRLYYYRGWAKEKLGKSLEAIIDYSTAIELDPELLSPLECRVWLREKNGDYTGVLRDLSKIIKIDPYNIQAYLKRIKVNDGLQNFDSVIKDFEKLIELFPSEPSYYKKLGNYKLKLSDYSGAVEEFARTINLFPKDWGAYYSRAQIYLQNENYSACIADASKVIEMLDFSLLDKTAVVGHLLRSEAYLKNGQFYEALQDFNHIVNTKLNQITSKKNNLRAFYIRQFKNELEAGLLGRSEVKRILNDVVGAKNDLELYSQLKKEIDAN